MLRPFKVDQQHIMSEIPGANYYVSMSRSMFQAIEFMLDERFGYRMSTVVAAIKANEGITFSNKWFYREDFRQNDVTVYMETEDDIEEVIKLMTFGRLKL